VLGRTRNLLTLPDGRKCWPRIGTIFREFDKRFPVRQYQVLQTSRTDLEARLVVSDLPNQDAKEYLSDLIAKFFGCQFNLRCEFYYDRLPNTQYKFEDFKSLL
jgi:phenylacetate-CoA ligase